MFSNIKQTLKRNLINMPGWHTDRKIVVIESDDWGSIRMDSKDTYNKLLSKGYPVDKSPYNRYDALESNDDMELLFDTLSSVKDFKGNPAIVTINNVVANPDFEKIKQNGYHKYFYETFVETLKRYPKHDRVIDLYHDGIANRLLKPQFHGREHVNISRWLTALQTGIGPLIEAFNYRMFSIHFEENTIYKNEYMDALDFDSAMEISAQIESLKEGLEIFKDLWGYQSDTFIANCYIWHPKHERALKEFDVNYIQGLSYQFIPTEKKGYLYKRKYHFLGQRNVNGQRYLIRNAFFEPYLTLDFDWVDDCMKRIEIAFKWKKPAIISTHRINFIGYLESEFRGRNLKLFRELLNSIIHKWPDVEFISSDELGKLIDNR